MTKGMMRPAMVIAAAIVFSAAASTMALAQGDAKELLKQAYELIERGRTDEALQKLNQVLATNPSADDAYQLRQALQADEWVRLSIANKQIGAAMEEIFNRGRPAAMAQTADKEAIKKLIEEARAGDFQAQQKALRTLAANHGDYAVQSLWQDLGSNDTERRVTTLQWLRVLGTDTPLPLIRCLESSDPKIRMNAAAMLGIIKDPRALPYLVHASQTDTDPTVKQYAAEAAAKIGNGGGSVGNLYVNLAERYYKRDPAVVNPYRTVYPVWSFAKEGDAESLVAMEVPRELYHLKLAEGVVYDLLKFEPDNQDAHTMLGSILIAEAELGRELKSEGDEAPVAAATAEARTLAATLGAATLDRVIAKAIADNRADVAEGAVRLLGATLTPDSFGSSNGLTTALSAPFKSVRFAAALAIAAIAPHSDFTGSEKVVENLAEALGQDAVRNVLVIDDNSDTRNRILADLNARNYFAVGTDDGAAGIQRLREYPSKDLVIVRYNQQGAPHVAGIINAIRRDQRTEKTPIAMIVEAADAETAKNQYGSQVQAFINSPPTAEAYEPQLKPLVASVDAGREQATLTAAAAATALDHMDCHGPGLASSGAAGALASTLKGDDRVRGPAIRALGKIGDSSTAPALLALAKDASVPEALRGDAIVSLAQIARKAGSSSPEIMGLLKESYAGQGSPEFQKAVARAIGIAPMSLAENVEILKAGRAKVMIDLVK
jgi:HEAT repeat protein